MLSKSFLCKVVSLVQLKQCDIKDQPIMDVHILKRDGQGHICTAKWGASIY